MPYKTDHIKVLKALAADLPKRTAMKTSEIVAKVFKNAEDGDRKVRNAYRMIRKQNHIEIAERGDYRLTATGASWFTKAEKEGFKVPEKAPKKEAKKATTKMPAVKAKKDAPKKAETKKAAKAAPKKAESKKTDAKKPAVKMPTVKAKKAESKPAPKPTAKAAPKMPAVKAAPKPEGNNGVKAEDTKADAANAQLSL